MNVNRHDMQIQSAQKIRIEQCGLKCERSFKVRALTQTVKALILETILMCYVRKASP